MVRCERRLVIILLIGLQNSTDSESLDISNVLTGSFISCCDNLDSCTLDNKNQTREDEFVNSTVIMLPRHLFVPNKTFSDKGQPDVPVRLEERALHCSLGKNVSVFNISLAMNNFADEVTKIKENGNLEIGSENFSREEFCVSSVSSEEILVKACKTPKVEDKCGNRSTCIRKCCGVGEVYDLTNYGFDRIQCVASSQPWSPTFYKNPLEKLDNNETEIVLSSTYIVSSHPREEWCHDDPFLHSQRKIRHEKRSLIRILENGSVLVKDHYLKWRILSPGSFCIDGAQNFPGYNSTDIYLGAELDTIIIDCSSSVDETHVSTPIIYGILQAIASCFLLLTAIVYAVLWERQNIHSWTLLGYVISMFCLYVSLTATYFHVYFWNDGTDSGISIFCSAIAIITHFFFLSTFCWMTLISFDVWWTFRDLKITVGNNKRRRRFLGYVIMAYVPPLILVTVGICLDHIYAGDIESTVIRPEYGGSKCFLDLKYAVLPYLILPIGTLLTSNLVFFGVTVYTLYKISESTKFATNMSSQSQPAKAKLYLFLKLFVVMGLTWSLDLVSWFVFGVSSSNPMIYIADILNILQPVAIFIIFVCKKEIIRALQAKFQWFRRLLNAVRRKQRSRRSASSNLTDDTNISTSSMRSLSGLQQNQISLNTIASDPKIGF